MKRIGLAGGETDLKIVWRDGAQSAVSTATNGKPA